MNGSSSRSRKLRDYLGIRGWAGDIVRSVTIYVTNLTRSVI